MKACAMGCAHSDLTTQEEVLPLSPYNMSLYWKSWHEVVVWVGFDGLGHFTSVRNESPVKAGCRN